MISSDKNVESIAQLVEQLKHYVGLQSEYVKLDVIEKVVKLVTAAALSFILMLLTLLILIYLSFAIAHALAHYMGFVAAFSIVAGIYLLLLILIIANRRRWIEKPLVKFLADLLLNN